MAAKKSAPKKSAKSTAPISHYWQKRGAAELKAIIGAQRQGILTRTVAR